MDQELVQYLDGRFQNLEERFQRIDERFERIDERFERIDQRFERIDQRFEQIDGRFQHLEERFERRLDERIEEVKRHTGVLVEGLRHEVQLVAEGFAVFVEGRYAQDQASIAQQFRETQNLIRLSFETTDQLRQRVENLERKFPN